MDYSKLAKDILKNVGGNENVTGLTHCATRLRFTLLDESKVNINELKSLKGVLGLVNSGGQFQVIIGSEVPKVFNSLETIMKFTKKNVGEKKNKNYWIK